MRFLKHSKITSTFAFNLFISFVIYADVAFCQVPVYMEPHHQLVSEKPYARVLDVQAVPGDTTAFHIHVNPICYIGISGSEIWLNEPNGTSRQVTLFDDYIGSDLSYSKKPFVHRFSNVGSNHFRLIAVENLLSTPSSPDSTSILVGVPTIIKNQRFTVTRMVIKQNLIIQQPGSPTLGVLVSGKLEYEAGTKHTLLDRKGDWIWLEGAELHQFIPHDSIGSTLVLVELH